MSDELSIDGMEIVSTETYTDENGMIITYSVWQPIEN
jgi:hypothetical protein